MTPASYSRTEDGYLTFPARFRSPCPHCTYTIEPGDAATIREGEERACHLDCARREDEIAADPEGVLARERAEFERRYRAEEVRGHRRKRKRRRSTA